MKKDLKTRIAIIGAGAAGLSAAEALKSKGYTHVTILEKSDHAGGKCSSFVHNGLWFELGAGVLSQNNKTVLGFTKKYKVPIELVDFKTPSLELDALTGLPLADQRLIQKIQLIRQGLKYRKLIKKYHRVTLPGLANVDEDLCIPFNTWAVQHGLELLAKEFEKYFTGFGYDFFDDVPAAYVLKYYSWETVVAFIKREFYKFPGGIQHLWTEVAKHHNVRFNTAIQRIERKEEIRITTKKETFKFDTLILTSPLDEALEILDASSEERELFSHISWCDYRAYACHISNFPKQTGYVPGNFCSSRKGHCVFWYHRHTESDLYTFYVLADWKMTDAEIQKNFEDLIRPLGGAVEDIKTSAHWKYFPHVTGQQMKDGYFEKLEGLQSRQQTYFAGELPNFSTVEQTAWYAKTLVERFF